MKRWMLIVITIGVVCAVPMASFADLSDGLVAHYPFDVYGSAYDASDNNHHGTTTGGVSIAAGVATFDGTGYISVPTSSDFDLQEYTISAWVNSVDGTGCVLAHGEGSNDIIQYSIWPCSTSYCRLAWYEDSGDNEHRLFAPSFLGYGTWYFVAITRDGSGNYRAYVDGNEVDSATGTPAPPSVSHPFTIGVRWRDGSRLEDFFRGVLDEVRVYDRALSQEEVCELSGGGACIGDSDSDGIPNDIDNCPDVPNGPLKGTCRLGDVALLGNECSSDDDCEEFPTPIGDCSMEQEDHIARDGDVDDDGVGDVCDNCPYDYNPDQSGPCYDGQSLCRYYGKLYGVEFPFDLAPPGDDPILVRKMAESTINEDDCKGRCGLGCPLQGVVECPSLDFYSLVFTKACLIHDLCVQYDRPLAAQCNALFDDAGLTCGEEICLDKDNDGVSGTYDLCPEENASGKDADKDGCIDAIDLLVELEDTIKVVPLNVDGNGDGIRNALTRHVQGAISKLQQLMPGVAANRVGAFINHVEDLRAGGILTGEDANSLTESAKKILTAISRIPVYE